jgi:protein arginine N-methyltransferase 1
MITDAVRVDRFREAIESCVSPGDVVLDLGSGTGILAILAARAGARIVYAVEAAEIVEIARKVCRENGVEDRVVFLDDFSQRVKLAEPADVLVTETIGNFGLDEGILGWVRDARRRFLKPDAIIVPCAIEMFVVPVEMPQAYARYIDWEYVQCDIDFSSMRPFAVNNLYSERIGPEHYLAKPHSLGEIALDDVTSTAFSAEFDLEVTKSGELHGLGGWFSSRLCNGVVISNDPHETPGSWAHAFMPLEAPVSVGSGDRLKVHVSCANNGAVWRWRLDTSGKRSGGKCQSDERLQFDHSTFLGSPAMVSHLHRQAVDHKPALNVDGRVTDFLLGLMDGKRTLEELSVLACENFPDRFPDPAAALEHVRALSAEFGC